MQLLEQSTAATVIIGPFVDNGDAVTPETGLAAGTVDEIGVYKHDATSLTDISGTTTFTHRAGGMYTATLSTSDTGTLGRLTLYVRDDDVCLPCWKDFMVVPSNVYDSLVGGSDKLQVHADEITAGLITAAAVATGAIDADAIADNAIDAGAIAADAITAAKIATDAITSDELAASAATEIADEILTRDWTSVSGEAARSVLNALRVLRNKISIATNTLTVTEEDDTTSAWTATVTTDASANPVTALTPD